MNKNIESPHEKSSDRAHKYNRLKRLKKQPDYLKDYFKCNSTRNFHLCNLIQFHALSSAHKQIAQTHNRYIEPNSYNEVSLGPQWVQAMSKELKALSDNLI